MARRGGDHERADDRIALQGSRAMAAGETFVAPVIDRGRPGECFRVAVWLRAGNGAVVVNAVAAPADGVAHYFRRAAGGLELVLVCGAQARTVDFIVEGVS